MARGLVQTALLVLIVGPCRNVAGVDYTCSDWPLGLDNQDVDRISCPSQVPPLSGNIPNAFYNLRNLRVVDFSGNLLSGHVRPLDNLTSLEELNLQENQFSGLLPAGLSTNITHLILNDNQFEGMIPAEYGNLLELIDLALFDNQLHGGVPPSFTNLTKLQYLSLENNRLGGPFPPHLASLTSLKVLSLENNKFEGCAHESYDTFCDDFGAHEGTGDVGCYFGHQACGLDSMPKCSDPNNITCTFTPTASPTPSPSNSPSKSPTEQPTQSPSTAPTPQPSQSPTDTVINKGSKSYATSMTLWLSIFSCTILMQLR